jgi:repressor LexA
MKNDEHVLECLRGYYAHKRSLPSYAELGRQAGLAVSTLAGIVNRLKANNVLAASATGRLEPGKRFFERSLVNHVQAGFPVPAAEVLPEGILIDEYLVDSPNRTVLLTVRGESMTGAGLLPGDVIVVKRGAVAREGDIVVAISDGDYTVKYLKLDVNGGAYLGAANAEFEDIRPQDELEIFGVVTGQFRRYRKRLPINSTG